MPSEFETLSQAAIAESTVELAKSLTIAGTSITRGTIQDIERGKELMSDAGFTRETGGTLIIDKADAPGLDPNALSGKVVTYGTIKRRIAAVTETRIALICELQPITR